MRDLLTNCAVKIKKKIVICQAKYFGVSCHVLQTIFFFYEMTIRDILTVQ